MCVYVCTCVQTVGQYGRGHLAEFARSYGEELRRRTESDVSTSSTPTLSKRKHLRRRANRVILKAITGEGTSRQHKRCFKWTVSVTTLCIDPLPVIIPFLATPSCPLLSPLHSSLPHLHSPTFLAVLPLPLLSSPPFLSTSLLPPLCNSSSPSPLPFFLSPPFPSQLVGESFCQTLQSGSI